MSTPLLIMLKPQQPQSMVHIIAIVKPPKRMAQDVLKNPLSLEARLFIATIYLGLGLAGPNQMRNLPPAHKNTGPREPVLLIFNFFIHSCTKTNRKAVKKII